MSSTFAEIVEEVKALSPQEKQELRNLIEKYLIEEARQEIYESYVHSLTELSEGKLEFSNETDRLRTILSND
jgi:phosphopantothenate synthetase